jgi:MFS superfamily sulfate permease-like transporter
VVVDAAPINAVDITALHQLKDLIEDLNGRGITLRFARVKQSLWIFFKASWIASHPQLKKRVRYNTLTSAVEAFKQREKEDKSSDTPEQETGPGLAT